MFSIQIERFAGISREAHLKMSRLCVDQAIRTIEDCSAEEQIAA